MKSKKELLLRIVKYLNPYWKSTIVTLIILLITSFLSIIPSIIVKLILDEALPEKNIHLIAQLVIFSLIVTVISSSLNVWQSYISTSVSQDIILKIKNQSYKHLQEMPYHFFTSVKQGEIITRMNNDISGIQSVFNGTIVNFINNSLLLVSTLVTLFIMEWKLALLGVVVLPLFIFPTKKVGNIRLKIAKQTQENIAMENRIINETLSTNGFKLMKLFNQEEKELNTYKKLTYFTSKLQIKELTTGRWFIMIMTVFTSLGPLLIYLYGGYLFIRGDITVGVIIAFVTLLARLYVPVGQLSNLYVEIMRSLALFERIFEYIDMKPQTTSAFIATSINPIEPYNISFNNVTFEYQKNSPILMDISFKANSGQITALVGPSGAGKTSIINLIPRLYEVNSGSIKIGDRDIRSYNIESLRSIIGLVTQETYLFNGTIKENLLYANNQATYQEIKSACETAYIHQFIMNMPNGYDTMVGNQGIKLSGGEKQRISLARVLLKDPPIIIMDEATSSLDAVSEYYIQKTMDYLLKEKTSLVIAHRLSTIKNASNILVIEEGTIVGQGTHEQLLDNNIVYKHLYSRQFDRDLELT